MENYLVIKDLVRFNLMNPSLVQIKDDFGGGLMPDRPIPSELGQFAQNAKAGLLVRIAATHAGIITGNNTFYLPDKVKAGVPSFVENYNKPVLLHHDEEKDPIGRIIAARYIDTSANIKDKWYGQEVKDASGKLLGTINEKLIKDFSDGSMPFGMQVDVIRNIFDHSILEDRSYEGLGFAEVVANITDPVAIPKFLDGRYVTGSVNAATDKAVCSKCKQDWTKDGMCDHRPGAIYDGKKAYLIAGNFIYKEYSMVNKPADLHSKVLELYYNGVRDSIELAKDYSGRLWEVSLGFPQYETPREESGQMTDKKKEEQKVLKDSEKTPEVLAAEAAAKAADEAKKIADAEAAKKTPETPVVPPVVESFDSLVDRLLLKDANKAFTAEDNSKLYGLLVDEMKALGYTEQEVKDSTAADKLGKLPKTAFCGPDRTFPAHDAAHLEASRSLLDKYAGKGDKKPLLAALDRKAKALGFSPKKTSKKVEVKDNMQRSRIMHTLLAAVEENYYTPTDQDPALAEDDLNALRGILKKLSGMVGKDSLAKMAALEKLGLDAEVEKVFVDEITSLENTIGTLRDEVKTLVEQKTALKEEYDALVNEMNVVNDSLVAANTASRSQKLSTLNLLQTLKDGKVVDKRLETLSTLSDEVVDSELTKLSSEVDMKKITDKLGDGTTRTPSGQVEYPDGKKPDVAKQNGGARILTLKDELDNIQATYAQLLFKNVIQAEQYKSREVERLRREGKLPKE